MAEAAFAAGHEQARSLADVLLRRTRLGLLDARALCGAGLGRRPAARRARMAGELGWDDARVRAASWRDWARGGRGARALVPGCAEVA